MQRHKPEPETPRWRIIVIGAEDVAEYLRGQGHRVLSMETIPDRGLGSADAAVVELDRVDARGAQRFRKRLVEPILIHHRPAARPYAFFSVRRQRGRVNLQLLEDLLAHAVKSTRLYRRVEAEDVCDFDAPTQSVTLSFALAPTSQRTVVARRGRLLGSER